MHPTPNRTARTVRTVAFGAAMIGMVATLPNDQAILDVIAHIQSLEK